ncbi:MAG TPA: extracellular solute-binding protein [Pseudomonas sp.]|nr:extracellular solute-binding protein [Pseudomonas sp.]
MLKRMLLALGLGLGASLVQAQEVVRVYGWQGRLAPSVIEEFQKQTGIHVEYSTYSSAEEMLAGVRYDVVFPSHFQLPALIAANRLQPLDPARLPNLAQVNPDLLTILNRFDSHNRFAVPYLWGTVGLALNVPKVSEALGAPPADSWSLLFDAKNSARLAKCGIGLLDAREETLSLLLTYKGRALSSSSRRDIYAAGEDLAALRDKVSSFGNNGYIEPLSDGRLCLALAWSGHVFKAAAGGAPLRFVTPQEGALMFIDTMAIPRNAQNVAAAHRFIDYLASAAANTHNARETRFYPVSRPDAPAMAQLASEHPELVPDSAQRRGFYYLEALDPSRKSVVDASWSLLQR